MTDNYPAGTDECFSVGISGGCDPECPVYLRGDCPEPQDVVDKLAGREELELHAELYQVANTNRTDEAEVIKAILGCDDRNDGDLSNMGCLAVAISAFLAVMLAAATLLLIIT